MVMTALEPGSGELLTDKPRRRIQAKAERDELAVTESLYAEGERGPPPHFHRQHCDCFYVLEGRLVFEVDGERTELEAGGWVVVPPLVVHTFRNEGPGDARFLNVHAPGMGFIQYLREGAASDWFDSFDPSEL
jgi:mannose-6-phosphate isomerase-like protein (cupin superfamily)